MGSPKFGQAGAGARLVDESVHTEVDRDGERMLVQGALGALTTGLPQVLDPDLVHVPRFLDRMVEFQSGF